MFLEHDGRNVWQVNNHVNDGKLEIRIFLGNFFNGSGLGKTRGNDGAVTLVGEITDRLFALGFGAIEVGTVTPRRMRTPPSLLSMQRSRVIS